MEPIDIHDEPLVVGRRFPYWLPRRRMDTAVWLTTMSHGTFYQDVGRTTIAIANGDPVASWTERGGLRPQHFTQDTSSKRPTLLTDAKNGHPAVRFDGVDDFLLSPSFARPGSRTIFLVLRQITWGPSMTILGSRDIYSATLIRQSPSTGVVSSLSSSVLAGPNIGLNVWFIYCVVFNEGASRIRLNDNAAILGDTGSNRGSGMVLGASGGNNLGLNNSRIDVLEVLEYPDALDAEFEGRIRNWLNRRWGVYP